MAQTATATENQWNDLVTEDMLFMPITKGLLWAGFAVVAVCNLIMSVLLMTLWFDVNGNSPGSLDGLMVFAMFNGFGSVAFCTGMACAALLPSRMPSWGRITLLCVTGLLLVGSTTAGGISLLSLLNAAN